jgi:hypothetical protein
MRFIFSPQVKILLIHHSNEKFTMEYLNYSWPMPVISIRPPYYTNPRYEPAYAII